MYFKTCEVCGLKSGRKNNEKRLFMAKFPLDESRCKQWVKAVGKPDLAYVPIEKLHMLRQVCGNHFKPKDFTKSKKQLKKSAIPSLLMRWKPLEDDLLKDFPLHVAKENITKAFNIDYMSHLNGDHNYCKPSTSEGKRQHSPEPSTSKTHTTRHRIICNEILPVTSETNEEVITEMSVNSNLEQSLCMSPRKLKLMERIKKYKVENKTLKRKLKIVEDIESPVLKSLIESNIINQKRKPQGKRWTNLNKSVALAIYKKSPKSFRYLSKLLLLPSIRSLQMVLENMKMEPGIDPNIMEHLRAKCGQSSEKEKCCALLFDEMALKKRLIYNTFTDKIDGFEDFGHDGGRSERIADHALVFMLQGLHKKLKQPICYYFVKGTVSTEKLSILIETVINSINAIGFKIICTVCDQGPTNMGALNLLKKRSGAGSQNYFLLNGEKIYIVFDVPHLFKSIRNNFLQAGEIVFNNKKGKWDHLVMAEEKNRMKLKFLKLTKSHVAPKYRAKMKVKTAAQVLSHTVSAILKLMAESVNCKDDSEAILQTAEIIEELDLLFDYTNGPASKNDIKKNIRTNVSKNSIHHVVWPRYRELLKTINFLKSDSQLRLRNVRCVNGYITTILSLQSIWEVVAAKGFRFLNLRQLNQDALENLFGLIRQHSPTNRNPTCHHFKGALKSAILTRLSTPQSKGTNCEKDDNEILFDFHNIVFTKPKDSVKQPEYKVTTSNEDIPVIRINDNETQSELEKSLKEIRKYFKTFEKQPTVYVSGYLAHAILKKNFCGICRDSLTVQNPIENSIYDYISMKEWWQDKQSLTYPTIKLCEAVDASTKLFEKNVVPCIFRDDLCLFSKTLIMSAVDLDWIECSEHSRNVISQLIQELSLLLIRNECKIANQDFARSEEKTSDTLKKAEQGIK